MLKKLSSRQSITKKLDALLFKVIVAKWGKKCVTCGSTQAVHSGHLFTRGYQKIKYDLRNVFPQCDSCNIYHEVNSAPFISWLVHELGQSVYSELYRDAHQDVKPIKTWELEETYKQLSEELKSLQV